MTALHFSVRPGESVADWTQRTVNGLVDQVLDRKDRSRGGTAETVHLIRTTTKQLRGLLRLLRPVISAALFQQEDSRLKQAAGGLSQGRDRTVARKTLVILADSAEDADRRALLRLRAVLKSTRSDSSADLIAASRHDLAATRSALLLVNLAGQSWASLALAETYRRARKEMKTAGKHPNAEALHKWRIAVKRLYYQFQWLCPLWPKRLSAIVPPLHDLEHTLGCHHDLAVLEELLLSRSGPSARLLKKAIRQRARHLKRRARSLGKKAFPTPFYRFARKLYHHAAEFSAPSH